MKPNLSPFNTRCQGAKSGAKGLGLLIAGLLVPALFASGAELASGSATNPAAPDTVTNVTVPLSQVTSNLATNVPLPAVTNQPSAAVSTQMVTQATNQSAPPTSRTLLEPNRGSRSDYYSRSGASRQPVYKSLLNYSTFSIIGDRNIFNPNRTPRTVRTERREYRPAARGDYFALAGTMSYANGEYAFFEGTSPEYRRTLKVADSIGGFQLMGIGYNQVKLAAGSNSVKLTVGMQMNREDSGAWTLSMRSQSAGNYQPPMTINPGASATASLLGGSASVTNGDSTVSTATNSGPAAASNDSALSVLERMRLRREQQLKK
ncbi:MAG: hypothetical protein WCO56_21135 [Verrucomicrobiota bacterium]